MHPAYQPMPQLRRAGAILARQAVALACLALAGCYTARETVIPADFDYRLRHNIAIKEGPRTIELFIGSTRGGLNGDQRADVLAFANTWRRRATGGILIDSPAGTRNAPAAANALHEVRAILSAAGVPESSIGVRPYRPADPSKLATIRLSYPTLVAEAGPCGLWPHDIGPSLERAYNENTEYWNLGCATRRNLAAMVENKADLVQPRGEIPAYTGRRTTVLDKYHRGEATQAVNPDKDQGKISDLGK